MFTASKHPLKPRWKSTEQQRRNLLRDRIREVHPYKDQENDIRYRYMSLLPYRRSPTTKFARSGEGDLVVMPGQGLLL